jgi:MarR family transcriptional regulator, organic hydroperoxide resistance regulator
MPDLDPAAQQDAQEIVALFRALRRGLLRVSRGELVRSGLTGAQLSVVSALGTRGPMPLTELGRELEIGHSTLSGIVDRLQAKGIVQRTPNPADRRYTLISLSETVSQHAQVLLARGPGSRLVAALASATPEERVMMRQGLLLLQRFLGDAWGEAAEAAAAEEVDAARVSQADARVPLSTDA